ncbi:MAG: M48 family metallopeptidase, partial [Pseudomonadales bacterium]|nr:M48 family metallopeptidase [Pseudomonadales bacterium]
MDFFESQDIARRNTRLLLFLFTLAVLSLVVLSNLLVFGLINFGDSPRMASGSYYYDLNTFTAVSVGVIVLVASASLIRMLALRKGGSAVAEMLDGELLVDPGDDINKKKLLNVVEEMAIASGTPVPPVYLIRDTAINAFAAGYSLGDAVIGVTYGAIANLSRDELQGVVAHEFSHILNGDMRMNIRLMGVLYGILVLTVIGRMLAHSSAYRASTRSSSGSSDSRLAVVGLGLLIIGYLGHFFGGLIKSAVSRQREYLADASAVQFTRNPSGIADALKRIGGYSSGTVVNHPESEELSHAFFCEGVTFSFAKMMATHPPLKKRIARIQPDWDGKYLEGPPPQETGRQTPEVAMGFAQAGTPIDADQVVTNIGNPDNNQIETARKIIGTLPAVFVTSARDPYSARALVYLMHLDADTEVRAKQLEHLNAAADLGIYDAVGKLILEGDLLKPGMRLPLLEMALPTLRQLSYEQYKLFLANL